MGSSNQFRLVRSAIVVGLFSVSCTGGTIKPLGEGATDAGADGPTVGADVGPSGGTPAPGGAGGDPGSADIGAGGAPMGGTGISPIAPYPGGCAADPDCDGAQVCRAGLCVAPPPDDRVALATCDDVARPDVALDFGCWENPPMLAIEGPRAVDMRGEISFFGDGNVTKDLDVRVYDFATWDPSPCSEAGEGIVDIARAREAIEACIDLNNEPVATGRSVVCEGNPTQGCYALTGVPTGIQLVVRVTGNARLWVPTYEYGVFINPCVLPQFKEDGTCPEQVIDAPADTNWSCSLRAGEGGGDPYMGIGLSVLSQTTWQTFPPTAGVARIRTGRGAIAGRVYDCQGRPVANAAAGFFDPGDRTTYFNGNPDDTLPQPGLTYTNLDATYANLDTPAGPQGVVTVAWTGEGADRQLVIANYNRIFLVPNTLIILSPSGRNPVDVTPVF